MVDSPICSRSVVLSPSLPHSLALASSSSAAGTCVFLEAQRGNLSVAKKPQSLVQALSRDGRGDQAAELAHKGVFLYPGRSGKMCHSRPRGPSRHVRCRALNS